jgi:hypothetical protein
VQCHRHPVEAVASHASLVLTLRRAYSERAEAAGAGRFALGRAAESVRRALSVRSERGEARFVDVSYARLAADPVAVVADVYRELGRELEDSRRQVLHRWLASNPRGAHGMHRYAPGDFDLRPQAVAERFDAYLGRFGPLLSG